MSGIDSPWIYPLTFGETLSTNDWIEWHLHRFSNSSFVARMLHADRRDAIGTAVMLWTESYKEDPAGTLPDDDVLLARLAGYGRDVAAWQEIRPLALYGWSPVLIESAEHAEPVAGRLGHLRIAEIAARSARRRNGRKAGREAAALAVTKSRIRAKLTEAGHGENLTGNDELVSSLARFLEQSNLYVTAENVAAALMEVAGISKVLRVFPRAKEGGRN